MFKNSDDLVTAILSTEPAAFVSHHIFEPVPHAFGGDQTAWIDYKLELARLLGVDPQEIVLTGSAALGFSLNPINGFSAFHTKSDFDFAVVSGHHFDMAWRYLRQLRVSWLTLPRQSQQAIRQHRQSYVFTGTIAANWFLQVLPFGKTWQVGLDRMSKRNPSIGRDIKLRIYKDYECLRFYQTDNLRRLKETLLSEDPKETETEIGADNGREDVP